MPSLCLPEPDQDILAKRHSILEGLRGSAPNARLIDDLDGLKVFDSDAFAAYRRTPLAVILPDCTEDVSRILKYAHENKITVIPRGAGTSLTGGALPQEDAIVLCITKMKAILDIDYQNRTATVQTGITNLGISNAVAPGHFFYAPDPSSQVACTLAGNIALNSGGAHCLKYGVTTHNLLGVKMVMMDGEVIEIGGDFLDAGAYDFLALVTGSEGQLGLVTEATVRILRAAEGARPLLLGFASSQEAGACATAIIGSGVIPVALEFMDKPAIHVCERFANAGYPLDVEALLIVELEGSDDEIAELTQKVIDVAGDFNPMEIRVSQSEAESKAIWRGRKLAFGAMGELGDYLCMDGTIPTGKLAYVLEKISHICTHYDLRFANIFHAGDGNLHPLILFNANHPEEVDKAEQCGADILKLCVEVGGCLTGEHGVGLEKRDLMTSQFTADDLKQQMQIKDIFDPHWLLNPSKVFPLEGRNGAEKNKEKQALGETSK